MDLFGISDLHFDMGPLLPVEDFQIPFLPRLHYEMMPPPPVMEEEDESAPVAPPLAQEGSRAKRPAPKKAKQAAPAPKAKRPRAKKDERKQQLEDELTQLREKNSELKMERVKAETINAVLKGERSNLVLLVRSSVPLSRTWDYMHGKEARTNAPVSLDFMGEVPNLLAVLASGEGMEASKKRGTIKKTGMA